MARRSKLIWTVPALEDLDAIAAWIAIDNTRAAAALIRRTMTSVERLRDHPDSGRFVPEVRSRVYREVVVPPCRIIYRREGSSILIVHIVRSERVLRPDRLV